jgi:Methyltransferase domain
MWKTFENYKVFLAIVMICSINLFWFKKYNYEDFSSTTDSFARQSALKAGNTENKIEKEMYSEIELQARQGLDETIRKYPQRVRLNLLQAQATGNSHYFTLAERDMDAHWSTLIKPYLPLDADYSYVLEIAPGHGRNTEKLRNFSKTIIGVDINQDNIDFLRKRFALYPDLHFYKTDGVTLPEAVGKHVTFVYSFDAMVHFDKEVVASYLKEISRVMRTGALGYLHHSQAPECPKTLQNGFCSKPNLLGDDPENPHQRNTNSKANIVRDAENSGLRVLNQYDISWDEKFGFTDAISIIMKI